MPKKTAPTAAPRTERVYQLKISLREARPPIWRRVLVPGRYTLEQLHEVIQQSFDWGGYHLHLFTYRGQQYSSPPPGAEAGDQEFMEDAEDERSVTLAGLGPEAKEKLLYVYDFGDDWEHEVLVEKVLDAVPGDPGAGHPVCLTGKRATPPEDVGGMWGYAEFLEVIGDPQHEEHEERLEWVGGSFDPNAFDLAEVNQRLASLKG